MIDNKSHEKGRSTNLTLNSRDKKQKKNPPQRQDGVGSLPYSQFSAANFVRNLLVGSILPLAVVAAGVGSGCQVVPAGGCLYVSRVSLGGSGSSGISQGARRHERKMFKTKCFVPQPAAKLSSAIKRE